MKKCLKQLVIDTATNHLYVSLVVDHVVLEEVYSDETKKHSETLMPTIERLFHTHGILVSDLDEIIVGIGPGSYTGLRIGVVVAKMFGWNNSVLVKTVSSLALLASSSVSDGLILPSIDARRGNAFCGLYQLKDGVLTQVEEDCLREFSSYSLLHNDAQIEDGLHKPNILCLLESDLLDEVDDIHLLAPNYLRITEAERNK